MANWVYGGFLAGVLLLLLAPVLVRSWPPALIACFLCLPVYMLHQYEEHDNDRFRQFVNRTAGGKEVLSQRAVFVINVPGVWGIIGVSLCLAAAVDLGYALIAVYLVAVNGLIHIAHTLIFRRYNPGLGTAILLFLPLSAYGIREVQLAGAGTIAMHATGLLAAIGIHAVIVAHVMKRRN